MLSPLFWVNADSAQGKLYKNAYKFVCHRDPNDLIQRFKQRCSKSDYSSFEISSEGNFNIFNDSFKREIPSDVSLHVCRQCFTPNDYERWTKDFRRHLYKSSKFCPFILKYFRKIYLYNNVYSSRDDIFRFRYLYFKDYLYLPRHFKWKCEKKGLVTLPEYELQVGILSEASITDVSNRFATVNNWLFDGSEHGNSLIGHYIKIPQHLNSYVSLLEDVLFLAHDMIRSQNLLDRYVAVLKFCKLRGNRIGFSTTLGYIVSDLFTSTLCVVSQNRLKDNNFYKNLEATTIHDLTLEERMAYEVQSGEEYDNIFAELRSKLGLYDKMRETTMYKKLHKFLLYVLVLGILDGVNISFDSLKFDTFAQKAIKRTHKPGFDMVHSMLDTLCFVCDRATVWFRTGNSDVLLQSGSSYETWLDKARDLQLKSKLLANPSANEFCEHKFIADLRDTIEVGRSILKYTAKLDKYEKTLIQKNLFDLQLIQGTEFTKKSAQSSRKPPFAVLVHGSSSICKSQLQNMLFYHYGKVFGQPTTENYKYSRCVFEKHWSGFDSSKWCIQMDDIAFMKPDWEPDPSLMEFLQIVNTVPYCPPQAELEDKGKTPIKPLLVIASSNTKHLNLNSYFSCPFAVARRVPFIIQPHVKKEYTKNSFMADSEKIPIISNGEYMNIWDFDIYVPRPADDKEIDNQQTKYILVNRFTDINDMLAWYITKAKEHEIAQEKAMNADKSMQESAVCAQCYRLETKCVCNFSPGEMSDLSDVEEQYNTSIYDPELTCDHCGKYMDYCMCAIGEEQKYNFENESDDDVDTRDLVENAINGDNNLDYGAFVEHMPADDLDDFNPFFKMKIWLANKIICYNANSLPDCCILNRRTWQVLLWLLISSGFCYPALILSFICALTSIYALYVNFWIIFAYFCMYYYGTFWKIRVAAKVCGTNIDSAKLVMRLFARRIKKIEAPPRNIKHLMIFVSSAAFGLALAKFSMNFKTKYKTQSEGTKPKAMVKEKQAFYYHDPYVNTGVEISDQSRCISDDLCDRVTKNMARFRIHDKKSRKVFNTTGVNIIGNIWMINKHSIENFFEGTIDVILDDTAQNVSRNIFGMIARKDLFILHPTKDLAFINLRVIAPGKNLITYFPIDDIIQGRYEGQYCMKDSDGVNKRIDLHDIHSGICTRLNMPCYFAMASTKTRNGDCGSVAVAHIGSAQVILGIHTTGNQMHGVTFQHVSQKDLNLILSQYEMQVDCGTVPISAPDFKRSLTDLHEKSSVRFLEGGTIHAIGSFAGYKPRMKSRVRKTFIRDCVVEGGYVDNFGPPDMSWKPWSKTLKDIAQPNLNIDPTIACECRKAFVNDILSEIPELINSELIHVYDLDTALNGADGIAFVDKLNTRTSAGNPFKKSKRHFIELDDKGKISHLNEVIASRINDIEACYSKATKFNPQYCGHLKDEAKTMQQIENSKTRVFMASEMAWSIVARKYYLSFIRLIQNNPFVFEAMPGIVAQSDQWQKLYDYLNTFGPNQCVAGDYKMYDKQMSPIFILEAFQILIELAKCAKWSDEDVQILWCIAYDTAYAMVDYNGDLLQLHLNPSGHPLTVIINCLVNSLYMRYVFKRLLPDIALSNFKKYIKLATYGDDNALCVSKKISDKYNHTTISVMFQLIGIQYTMADKTSESIPLLDISQISFLKREFQFCSDFGVVVAPLEHSSIDKMLTNYVDNGVLSPQAHSVCVIETALREYAFYGKEIFEERTQFFKEVIRRMNLEVWVRDSTFPSFSSCVEQFWLRSGCPDRAVERFVALEEKTSTKIMSEIGDARIINLLDCPLMESLTSSIIDF